MQRRVRKKISDDSDDSEYDEKYDFTLVNDKIIGASVDLKLLSFILQRRARENFSADFDDRLRSSSGSEIESVNVRLRNLCIATIIIIITWIITIIIHYVFFSFLFSSNKFSNSTSEPNVWERWLFVNLTRVQREGC